MREILSVTTIFFILAHALALPEVILATFLTIKRRNYKPLVFLLDALVIGLNIGCLVLALIHWGGSSYSSGWVSFGLGVGSVSVATIELLMVLLFKEITVTLVTGQRIL
jgi:hypothetical protein